MLCEWDGRPDFLSGVRHLFTVVPCSLAGLSLRSIPLPSSRICIDLDDFSSPSARPLRSKVLWDVKFLVFELRRLLPGRPRTRLAGLSRSNLSSLLLRRGPQRRYRGARGPVLRERRRQREHSPQLQPLSPSLIYLLTPLSSPFPSPPLASSTSSPSLTFATSPSTLASALRPRVHP